MSNSCIHALYMPLHYGLSFPLGMRLFSFFFDLRSYSLFFFHLFAGPTSTHVLHRRKWSFPVFGMSVFLGLLPSGIFRLCPVAVCSISAFFLYASFWHIILHVALLRRAQFPFFLLVRVTLPIRARRNNWRRPQAFFSPPSLVYYLYFLLSIPFFSWPPRLGGRPCSVGARQFVPPFGTGLSAPPGWPRNFAFFFFFLRGTFAVTSHRPGGNPRRFPPN